MTKVVVTRNRVTPECDSDFARMVQRAERAHDRDIAERARTESVAKRLAVRMLFWTRFSLP